MIRTRRGGNDTILTGNEKHAELWGQGVQAPTCAVAPEEV